MINQSCDQPPSIHWTTVYAPRNPDQPAESAKPVHYIQCAGIKLKFAKIVTNRYTVYVYPENLEMNLGLADRVSTGLPPKN